MRWPWARLTVAMGLLLGESPIAVLAQEPPALEWEFIGLPEGATALAVKPSAAGDTLYAIGIVGDTGVHRLDPGATEWSEELGETAPDNILVTRVGSLLIGAPGGPTRIWRSTDGGQTWAQVHDEHVACLYERPSDGALLACNQSQSDPLVASTDDGLTWTALGRVTAAHPSVPNALLERPEAAPGGTAPRLVAAVQNGLAYSDDGGLAWAESNIWEAFRWWGSALAQGTAYRNRDTLYAAMRDFATAEATVLASGDGAVWEERSRIGIGFPTLIAGRDGALYLALDREASQTRVGANLWRSSDGGGTWAPVMEGYDEACVLDLVEGTDGRLYLAGCSGVWRTQEVLPVSSEPLPAPPGERGVRLEVAPNPFRGETTVTLMLPEAAEVRLALYDVLGREVALLAEGRFEAGRYEATLNGEALAAGLYLVRASVEGRPAATQRLTLLK